MGAPPDATYGESIETPNHRRQRLAAEEAEASGVPSPDENPSPDALRAVEDSTAKPGEAAPTPAWRNRPVWGLLGTADRCIDPGVHRFSYERMGAQVTEIEGGSHVIMISHPKEVAGVVRTALRTCAVPA